ncbi:hypothetical protein ABW20_dc0101547 [Dactylellina cionopaga]|nr:hypothetical protein ABW20_dc0101547 [Dactylellina cionopaga]
MAPISLLQALAYALSLSAAVEPVFAAPASAINEDQFSKRATSFAITGGSNGCVDRQRIDLLQSQKPDTFNLLLLALAEIQSYDASNPWSYYQLAGK